MLLEVESFNLWFRHHDERNTRVRHQALHDISLQIHRGQTVALVGESGSGKTITALSLLRLLEEISDIDQDGRISLCGTNLLDLPLAEIKSVRGNDISMIFQEPMTSLNPVYTVGNQLMEPLQLHRKLSATAARKEAALLLDRTGLDDPEGRLRAYPHQLSGGQRQRVMIAMALACSPSLLIADEPTTALDVTIQAQILRLLDQLRQELGMGILLITHDLTIVEKYADSIYIMQDGRVVEQGDRKAIFEAPQQPYTRRLVTAIPSEKTPKPSHDEILLETKDLTTTFQLHGGWVHPFKRKTKTLRAVDGVNLRCNRGATWGIVGESGSGKTTLGLAILKLVQSTGEIRFSGTNIQPWSAGRMRPLRCDMQIVFQDPYSSLSPRMTVFEIIEEGLLVHRPQARSPERFDAVTSALERVGLEVSMANRYPHEFSGGQRQRIAIARVLVLNPRLLILDEPTSALDITIQGQIIELLLTLQKQMELTYIFISHDLRVVRAMADFIGVMQKGVIVEAGPAEEILNAPTHPYTKTLFQAAL